MFARKLKSLQCPCADAFNWKDVSQFRSLIVWLEDQKIRHYKVEDRVALRSITSSTWDSSFHQYLKELECPYGTSHSTAVILEWLLGFAVRLEYTENSDKYVKPIDNVVPMSIAGPSKGSDNPLEQLNYKEDDFQNGVLQLANLLGIAQHPDHLVVLKAVSKVISERLSNAVVNDIQQNGAKKPEGTPMPLDELVLGLDTGDKVLNNAARVLRLLHIEELRKLQTAINETIVAVQLITADPKTDERLGQVGR